MKVDWNWWNISIFCIIPIFSVVTVYFLKRKFLWAAPLVSTGLSIIVSIIAMPSILRINEHRAMFFGIVIPIQLGVVITITVIVYLITYIFKWKKK